MMMYQPEDLDRLVAYFSNCINLTESTLEWTYKYP